MNRSTIHRPRARRATLGLLLLAATGSGPAMACELDGLSHGYGPMSAIFAGAHRYQALNGLEEEEEAPPADAATVDAPADAAGRTPPPTPRRSFVAWAKAKPKPAADAASAETPATWTRVSEPRADAPADTAPEAPAASERSN